MLINGKMLRAVRERKGLSQEELAEKSRIGIATIKRIETIKADQNARPRTVENIANALGVQGVDLSGDNFARIVDIGGDIELHIDKDTTAEEFEKASQSVVELLRRRNRVLK